MRVDSFFVTNKVKIRLDLDGHTRHYPPHPTNSISLLYLVVKTSSHHPTRDEVTPEAVVLVFIHPFLLILRHCQSFFNCNYLIPCSAKDDYNIDKESYHSLTISSDGSISRYFPTIYKSSCKLDVRNFPFDDQVTDLNDY